MKIAYLIGIKGVGMTALAVYLQQAGFKVSGSDNANKYPTDEILKKEKIEFFESFDQNHLKDIKPDYVIVSGAYGLDNPEVKEAYNQKLNILYHSEALGMITSEKKVVAVAGVHGKTTTTAMIASILEEANFDPSFFDWSGRCH